jgi:hypothetical protein
MDKIINHIKSNQMIFYISLAYVGLGTLAICSIYGADPLYGEWSMYVFLLTFPVTFISFAYRYVETDYLIPVLIIQFIMFWLTYLILAYSFRNETKLK